MATEETGGSPRDSTIFSSRRSSCQGKLEVTRPLLLSNVIAVLWKQGGPCKPPLRLPEDVCVSCLQDSTHEQRLFGPAASPGAKRKLVKK